MHEFELRVHIGAPSMVKDDRRWQNVANGVINFRPARRISASDNITGENDPNLATKARGRRPNQAIQHANVSSNSMNPIRDQSSPKSSICGVDQNSQRGQGSPVSKKRANELCLDTNTRRAKRTKRASLVRARTGTNPAFKNPISGMLKARKAYEKPPSHRTPSGKTVLVPVTTAPKTRNSALNAAKINTSRTDAVFTHAPSNTHVEETLFPREVFVNSQNLHVSPLTSLSTSLLRDSFERQYFPPNQEAAQPVKESDESAIAAADVTFRLSQTSLRESDFMFGTTKSTASADDINDQNEVVSGRTNRSLKSTGRTETPSNPDEYLADNSPLARKTMTLVTPIVDLTGDDDQNSDLQVTRREVLGPISSPLRTLEGFGEDEEEQSSQEVYLEAVRKLPKRIKCQASNTNVNRQFRSFIPDYMLSLAQQYNLIELFRPLNAPTSIKNSERGYWKMIIQITDLITIMAGKRKSPTTSQWSEQRFMIRQEARATPTATTPERDAMLRALIYPTKQPGSATLWLAEQFIQFWNYLAKTIERGRAGYDARATIDSCKENCDGLRLEIRVWSYAENLTHIWLTLLGLSDGLTSEMPMQWCIPGKGALITMSGQPKNAGSGDRWIEKRSGLEGYWGRERVAE